MAPRQRPPSLAVLDAALTWTCGSLQLARAADPLLPTPCAAWTLRDLLVHMHDSLAALGEAARLGHVAVEPAPGDDTGALVDRVCRRALETRTAWAARVTSASVRIDDLPLGRDTLALVGAVEVLVHGWDVARTVEAPYALPEDLGERLLPVARAVVGDRGRRFAPAVPLPAGAPAADRLLAHLGRDPGWCRPVARTA
ncbi:TIGR03086 family metal-binding protein [Nocardioides aequoreus]|uniref:TIGR03086 family metal-binding protein n=1 Tax=Nocardioides aequoreus TaxID=397278 RepID=UPI0004C4690F|nr:TIGR03086 family metal-binding protein [Nocardioides aequoreus]